MFAFIYHKRYDIISIMSSQLVTEWVNLDEQIKVLNDQMKSLRVQKNTINEQLIQYMEAKNIESIETNIGTLKLKKRIMAGTLNKENVESTLKETLKKVTNPSEIAQAIFDNRDKTEKSVISLQKSK